MNHWPKKCPKRWYFARIRWVSDFPGDRGTGLPGWVHRLMTCYTVYPEHLCSKSCTFHSGWLVFSVYAPHVFCLWENIFALEHSLTRVLCSASVTSNIAVQNAICNVFSSCNTVARFGRDMRVAWKHVPGNVFEV